jgi:predicted dehydrogenase
MRTLGVGLVGVGWVAAQHLQAFQHNPHARIVALCTRDETRARRRLKAAGIDLAGVRFTRRYDDLLGASDIDIVSIATPNHLHADQTVRAARAGKHLLLEKPTGLDAAELVRVRRAVKAAGVRTIVSFELRYHPYLRAARWLRESGQLGHLVFARFQYLSRVTDWYSGWSWVRTRRSGRSHLLAAGCHAADAMRWCTGLEPRDVTAFQAKVTPGYEWPTSIVANFRLGPSVLGQLVSSTDFQMPYTFGVEMMGDRATLKDDLILWNDAPVRLADLRRACPVPGVGFAAARTPTGARAIRIVTDMPGSADVAGHPFQGEIDELVAAILGDRDTDLDVFDAERTMRMCLAVDRSAAANGRRVRIS